MARDGSGKSRGQSARRLAAGIVRGVLEGRGAARTHVERAVEGDLPAEAAGLLTELVYGTVRRAATIDFLLARQVGKGDKQKRRGRGRKPQSPPLARVEPDVLAHLRIGAYQLLFLERVPQAVAVSEAVEGAGRPSVRGFVNGVLRGLGRLVASRLADDALPPKPTPARLLLGREHGWVVLGEDALPWDPDPDSAREARWLTATSGLPAALIQSWLERHELARALELARAHNAPPPLTLRINPRRTTRDALLGRLRDQGLEAEPGPRPESILLGSGLGDGGFESLWTGEATVQDLTAMGVAPFLRPQPGERVLDLCAAPGGKTTHLAELMQDEGQIVAVDVDSDRLERVERAANRLGLSSIKTYCVDPEGEPGPPGHQAQRPFDRVLVDVPCSNTGVMRRRVELRHRLTRLDDAALDDLQLRLLNRACELVKPGGTVVYSTCATEPRENQERVRAFLASAQGQGITLEKDVAQEPTVGGGDGGYMARLKKDEGR